MVRDPVYRMPDTCAATGLSRSAIYAFMKDGKFPQPLRLSARSIGWKKSTIDAWLAARRQAA